MGNFWKGTSDEKLKASEKTMLEFSGIPFEEFKVHNVFIDGVNYIRTIEIGNQNKEKLVLIHGYGASGIIFWKILKDLS